MNSVIKLYIVDDESLARERLKRLLSEESSYQVCGESDNGEDALEHISAIKPDIVLLDIRMPGMDGLEVAERLSALAEPPAIIFCTAYDQYAIEAFRHQAIGYLLKPASKTDLLGALSKAQQLNQLQIKQLKQETNEDEDAFVANTWQGQEVIPLSDIYLFRADHKYLTIIHKGGESISDQTLKDLEQRYAHLFIRSHRNSLVNKKEIEMLTKQPDNQHVIVLKHSQEKVPVSRRHVSDIKAYLSSL